MTTQIVHAKSEIKDCLHTEIAVALNLSSHFVFRVLCCQTFCNLVVLCLTSRFDCIGTRSMTLTALLLAENRVELQS